MDPGSKQRVVDALNHREPDRIPLDLGSTGITGISRQALVRYLEFVGMPHDDIELYEVTQQLGVIPETLLQWLGVDVRGIDPRPGSKWQLSISQQGDSEVFYDEWGIGWRKPLDSRLYFDMYHAPLARAESVADYERHNWPDPNDPVRYEQLQSDAALLEVTTGAAIVLGRMAAGTLELAAWTRGMENFYMDLAAEPGLACSLLDIITEIKMRYWELAISRIGERITVITEADDMASQHSLIVSPDIYRRLIKPRHKRLLDHIHKLAPHAFIFFHSCGAIRELIPDLIEIGVDILNPVQVSAADMDPAQLKREFGSELTFWGGGVDTQKVLPNGTPGEVRDEVRRRIDQLAPGGGFVFSTVHNIQSDVPPENLAAMFETLHEHGVYPGPESRPEAGEAHEARVVVT